MSPLVLRLLFYMYTHQKLQVWWGEHIGNMVSVSNGVKQGGVLSPTLFSVYLDGLLRHCIHTFNKNSLIDIAGV